MNNVVLLVIAGVGTVLYMNSQNDKKGEIKEHIEPVNVDDGFYKNELTRILLPEELQKVDNTIRTNK